VSLRVLPPDPRWPARFEALRDGVWPALRGVCSGIEHVGSTSVPGLAAKDVIDLDVVVADAAMLASAIQALSGLGYRHRGELGIAGRHAFEAPAGSVRHNLYVCIEGALSLRNHRLLRDHLRAQPAEAAEYGALKRGLAARFPDDIDRYTEGKSAFILGVLRRSGVAGDGLAEIEAANRVQESTPRDGG
jgi:GrpB-like predicted nucleotidyltransferase (UPF0157 family)